MDRSLVVALEWHIAYSVLLQDGLVVGLVERDGDGGGVFCGRWGKAVEGYIAAGLAYPGGWRCY